MSDLYVLPFKRVVIYKHGVAYFEREGTVEGDCSLDLDFKPAEMNDIIRSLRAVDLNGGQIANISYGSAVDAEQTPKSVGPIYQFLIGSNVKLTMDDASIITGRILSSYENSSLPNVPRRFEMLVDNVQVKFIDANKVDHLDILDSHIKGGVKEYLDTVVNSKKKDKRQVNIVCKGKGKRTIRVSYILENPIWKSSYRIYMKQAGDKKQFHLEGWACVDNTSEDDWNQVSLALVSGSPISFQYEVYNPILGMRPDEYSDRGKTVQHIQQKRQKLNHPAAIMQPSPPQQINQQQIQMMQMQQAQQQMQQMQPSPYNYNNYNHNPFSNNIQMEDADSGPRTQTVEIGNLFHYEITPHWYLLSAECLKVDKCAGLILAAMQCIRIITIARDSSLIQKRNAMACIMMQNTLGTILDKGPVIITEDENYLGESLLENIAMQDEHKLLPYSANLECKVMKNSITTQTPHATTILNNRLISNLNSVTTTVYTLTNNSEREIELVLDHDQYIESKIAEAKQQAKWKDGTRFYVMLPPIKKTPFNIPVKLSALSKYEFARLYCDKYLTRAAFDALAELYNVASAVSEIRASLSNDILIEEQIINDQRRIQGILSSNRDKTFEAQLTVLETSLSNARAKYATNYNKWRFNRKENMQKLAALHFELNLVGQTEIAEDSAHRIETARLKEGYSKSTFQEYYSEQGLNGKPLPPPSHQVK